MKRMSKKAIDKAIAELVAVGDLEQVGTNEAGEPLFRLTEQGTKKVEAMPGGKVESARKKGARTT